jgi:hypothetical protein
MSQEEKRFFLLLRAQNLKYGLKGKVPKYVPAREAYTGQYMKDWLNSDESKKYPWLVFSSKYGIIEPDHPIRNYDIHFIWHPGAISEKTILRQILFQEFNGLEIKNFDIVYFVGSLEYYRKLKQVFAKAGMELHYYELGKRMA